MIAESADYLYALDEVMLTIGSKGGIQFQTVCRRESNGK